MLAAEAGKEYDDEGRMAAGGNIHEQLLHQLNSLEYYKRPYPKSLANDFGTDIVYPLIKKSGCGLNDALRTYTEHIALQITKAITGNSNFKLQTLNLKLLCTGGGALNSFLVERLKTQLASVKCGCHNSR
jgi:anhydro-N-acetylmuramic acid kinase